MPSRNEQYLEAAVNKSGTDGLPEPRTRNEKLLHRLVEEVSSGGLPEGGSPYQQLVTDSEGNVKWEDRLAYDDSRVVIDGEEGAQLVKVADEVPSWATVDAFIRVWDSNGNNNTVPPEANLDFGNGSFVVTEGLVAFITTDNFEFSGVVFPEKGVYFLSDGVHYVTGIASADSDTPEITWNGKVGNVKTIDPKYIKDMYYTQTIPGSDGPIITFQAYLNTISPLTLSEPLIVGAPYTVNVGDDKYKITCTAHGGGQLCIIASQGSLVVNDPINNPLVALWNGAVTNKRIEIVRESQEEVKQIDPKYIKDMYYDNLQSASYAIYTGGLTEFPRSELYIPLEMWKLLLDENATITDETTGSVMMNRTVVGSAAGERVCYDTGIPGISSLFISTMYQQAYLVVSSAPDDRLGDKRTIKVSIGTVKQIDQKYIPPTTVMVNIIPNKDGTFSADKTYMEVKELIDNGVDVKCVSESVVIPIVAIRDTAYIFAVEYFPEDFVLTVVISDGGCEVMRNRPSDAISDLIDAKLGVIENGSY